MKILRFAMRWHSRLSNPGVAALSARFARIAYHVLSETLQDPASRAVVYFRVLGSFVYAPIEVCSYFVLVKSRRMVRL